MSYSRIAIFLVLAFLGMSFSTTYQLLKVVRSIPQKYYHSLPLAQGGDLDRDGIADFYDDSDGDGISDAMDASPFKK